MHPLPKAPLFGIFVFSLLLAACGSVSSSSGPSAAETPVDPSPEMTASPPAARANAPSDEVTLLPEEPPPSGAAAQFSTDFSKHSVPYSEILSGGPPKDGIPPIDDPQFVSIAEADAWLDPREPVALVQVGADVRAYPLQILTWHEIVNDTVGGLPLTITFCPLCNTAIAFERTVDGITLDFGTTGRLRFSNLIMYDRQTETWWQQGTGEAIAGELTGVQLTFYPAALIAWSDFKAAHPDGQALSRETGFQRNYGQNPYVGYDDANSSPFLYRGPTTPDALPATARVLTVDRGATAVAYPYALLEEMHVINDSVGGVDLVVLWAPGVASALDAAAIAEGRDVGSANAYTRQVGGQALTFAFDGAQIVDDETGSVWNHLGEATDGPLAGAQLEPVVAINHFWFSWAAFKPETRIYRP